MQPYAYNTAAVYKAGGFYSTKKVHDFRYLDIYVSNTDKFTSKPLDIFSKYKLPYVKSDEVVNRWNSDHILFYQNQVNWAVWCATSGCGISAKDHLSAPEPLMRSFYEFHIYYQIRRLLKEIRAALPQDETWDPFNNKYNRRAYEQICNTFKVDVNNDWRQRASRNRGLGDVYNYWTRNGYHIVDDGTYNSQKQSFTQTTTNAVLHIDYISQGPEADGAWTTFIADESQGFTKQGVIRLDESIRVYVTCILMAQGRTRSSIIGSGNALTTQEEFLSLIETAIGKPLDAPEAIAQYQASLQYAESALNYVVGYDLYLLPSNMQLRKLDQSIAGYNNLIIVSSNVMKLGSNEHVNNTLAVVKRTPQGPLLPHHVDQLPPRPPPQPTTSLEERALADEHTGEKIALSLGLTAAGIAIVWYFHR